MFHELIQIWFQLVHDWGYFGIFILMAMESSIFPVPSEAVVPPAAYWAMQGRFSLTGVIVASTAGSLFGSLVTYAAALALGRPLVRRYGPFVGLSAAKVDATENLLLRYSSGAIFFARLLPVVRHLISIPAGLVRMGVVRFTVLTTVGAAIWCSVLAWFSVRVFGNEPDLIADPEKLVGVLKAKVIWFVLAAVLLLASYVAVKIALRRAGGDQITPGVPQSSGEDRPEDRSASL